MNILDENIVVSQRGQLTAWKIHFRRIGEHLGDLGMEDREEIIPLLHALRRSTFFTMDRDFSRPATSAASCATLHFAPRRSGWARSCACATAG